MNPVIPLSPELLADIAAVQHIDAVKAILSDVCRITGMGFAAVARVTEHRWIACQVRDDIGFGLNAGEELEVRTTICDEIRVSEEGVAIDDVEQEPMWRTHPTPIMYGFRSYISIPILRADGSFFGTLCAVDPAPRASSLGKVRDVIEDFARDIARELDALSADRVVST
uniref:GAF domain-containing protein n=1 Tax=Sphingomonas sp. TaxID=28214 RepID=UPI0025E18EFA|nr:GAF domain-containing protein [Sphingomonas sp.]